jgi:hypothetical protein
MPQFQCNLANPYDPSSGCPTIYNQAGGMIQTSHAYIQEQWDQSYDGAFGRNVGYLIAIYCAFVLFTCLALKYLNHLKR